MKTSSIVFPFLVIAFSTHFLVSCDAFVRDMNGGILRNGAYYYIIMPGARGNDGAITPSNTRNGSSPLDAAQSKHGTDKKYIAMFSFNVLDVQGSLIRESTDLNIDATGESLCAQSMILKLDSYDGEYVVSTGGVIGNPGAETLGNWFKIKKYLKHYKLVYCSSVCNTCKAMCKDIGISTKDNSGRLVRSDKPLLVMFKP